MKKTIPQPAYDTKAIRMYMALTHDEYEYSTALAEMCAADLDIYEERIHYTIPEIVYEIALEFFPED